MRKELYFKELNDTNIGSHYYIYDLSRIAIVNCNHNDTSTMVVFKDGKIPVIITTHIIY